MAYLKAQFYQNAQPSYDPKQYTKFLESQLDNFGALQQSVETTKNELNTLRVIFNQQEQRIAAYSRLIQLMQQVLEKQQKDWQQAVTSIRQAVRADIAYEAARLISAQLGQLESRVSMVEVGYTVLHYRIDTQHYTIKPTFYGPDTQATTAAFEQAYGCVPPPSRFEALENSVSLYYLPASYFEQHFDNSATFPSNYPQRNTIPAEVQTNPAAYEQTKLINEAKPLEEAKYAYNATQDAHAASLNVEYLRSEIMTEISQSLPQIIASQLSQTLPVIQDNLNQKATEIQESVAQQLGTLIDGLYERLRTQSSSISSAEYKQRLDAINESQCQGTSQRDEMRRILEQKFDGGAPEVPLPAKKKSASRAIAYPKRK